MRCSRLVLPLLAAVALALPASALARPGQLDPTFGTGGIVAADVGPFADAGQSLARRPDGGIVVAGTAFADAPGTEKDVGVLDLDVAGRPRAAFGTAGHAIIPLGVGASASATALGVRGDGSLVVGALTNKPGLPVMVATVSPTGVPGAPAFLALPAGIVSATDLRVDGAAGFVYVAGRGAAGNSDVALTRYTAAGTLDTGFGVAGLAHRALGAGTPPGPIAPLMTLQPDGRALLAGLGVEADNTTPRTSVVRFDTAGTPDAGFGTGGQAGIPQSATTPQSPPRRLSASAAGVAVLIGSSQIAVERFRADGSVEPAFSGDGYARVSNGNLALSNDLVLGDDGTMVLTGSDGITSATATQGVRGMSFSTRVLPDGTRDPTFGIPNESGPMSAYPTGDADQGIATASLLTPEGFVAVGAFTALSTTADPLPPTTVMVARLRTAPDRAPLVSLAAAPATQNAVTPVAFTATATDPDVGGSVGRYEWDFDGDTTIDRVTTTPTTSFVYRTTGAFTATVNAIDDEGVAGRATAAVTITSAPEDAARIAAPRGLRAVGLATPKISRKAKAGKRTVTASFTKLAGAAGPLRAFAVLSRNGVPLAVLSKSLRANTKSVVLKAGIGRGQKLTLSVTLVDRFGNVRTLKKAFKVT